MIQSLPRWFRRKWEERREAVMFERMVLVRWDDAGIQATYPKGDIEATRWDEVQRIAIETNNSGPWGADFWWLLEGAGEGERLHDEREIRMLGTCEVIRHDR